MNQVNSKSQPLIAIIIPVYNVGDYLHQCLDSVTEQTYSNLQILIVDDGSTDGCDLICDEYSSIDSRITVFHTTNRGLAAARNYGIDHVNKETQYIMFLDSDDWIEPITVQTLYETAAKNQADLVICPYYLETTKCCYPAYSIDKEMVLNKDQIPKHYIRDGGIPRVAWNKLYKASLFQKIRYPEGRVYEDIFTTYKVIEVAQKAVAIPL